LIVKWKQSTCFDLWQVTSL